jgi:hypothetical protein
VHAVRAAPVLRARSANARRSCGGRNDRAWPLACSAGQG